MIEYLGGRRICPRVPSKKDITNLQEILVDMDAMISPMSKDAILIKIPFKIMLFSYMTLKICKFFN